MPEAGVPGRVVTGSLRLLGAGRALPVCHAPDGPRSPVSNGDLAAILGAHAASDRRRRAIERMLADGGGRERYWSHWIGSAEPHPDEPTAAALAAEAAAAALADAGLAAADVDLFILALSTSTYPTIATATDACDQLGFGGPSFDVKAGCAGSLYALQLASVLCRSYRRILVVGADCMSKYLDPAGLLGFATVGDAAAALVVERGAEGNFVSAVAGDYGTWRTAGVFGTLPPDPGGDYRFRGTPTRLRDLIARRYRESLRDLLDACGVAWADLAGWIPHAIAGGLVRDVHAGFGGEIPLVDTFARYGNTGAASLLLGLQAARGTLGPGWAALTALGGGMRWGSALWRDME
ncbi:MAG: hypothetical protein FJZ01_26205 [Candidatus Sericytochromatia bacterium]|nr:hypothetical protein [Candidatus Tanganyikabacteria bacterium]